MHGEEIPDSLMAAEIVRYCGGEQLGGKPLCPNSVAVESDNSRKTFGLITKQELYEALSQKGFVAENTEFEELKTRSDKDIASEIEQYLYDRGEYDAEPVSYSFIASSEEEWKMRDLTEQNIAKLLEKPDGISELKEYLKNDLSIMAKYDELLDKNVLLSKILDVRFEQLAKTEKSQDITKT